MLNYAQFFGGTGMVTVYYFSGSGHSLAVAKELSEMLACQLHTIGRDTKPIVDETAVVVFPVYCQNIPKPVADFLKLLRAKHIVLIATYGRISYGRVLYEAQKLVSGDVIAGAYIPTGHTFLDGTCAFDKAPLLQIVERIQTPKKVCIPKTRKNPLANISPAFRSRIGVRLIKDSRCDHCGICEKECPMGAIRNGKTGSACIRCLRCVTNCPQKALQYKNSWILDLYLKSYCLDDSVLYL